MCRTVGAAVNPPGGVWHIAPEALQFVAITALPDILKLIELPAEKSNAGKIYSKKPPFITYIYQNEKRSILMWLNFIEGEDVSLCPPAAMALCKQFFISLFKKRNVIQQISVVSQGKGSIITKISMRKAPEEATGDVLWKKVFFKISQNLQENTRVWDLRTATLLKKIFIHRCFPENFKNTFFTKHLRATTVGCLVST